MRDIPLFDDSFDVHLEGGFEIQSEVVDEHNLEPQSFLDDGFCAVAGDATAHIDQEAEIFWRRCLTHLRPDVPESDLNQWLSPLKAMFVQDRLVLYAINTVFIRRIESQYLPLIKQAVVRENPYVASVELKLIVPATTKSKKSKNLNKSARHPTYIEESDPLNNNFNFENFVKGKSNLLAYNACYDLAKNINSSNTHLYFIYGSSGLGKTHLMHALAHRYQKAGLSVCYFTKDRFFKVTINALRNSDGGADALIKRICQADLLMVDDVHFINNKNGPKVSQLLMTLFGEFTRGDKKLILASDRPPSQMQDFDTRFLSRFEGGLSLPIEAPDIETRVQILQKKADFLGMNLPKDCAIFIAQNMPPDVRRLEGALNQVRANALLANNEITLSLVRHAIKDRVEARAKAVNAENIRDVVAEYYGISTRDILSKKRTRTIARPRQMAMALVRELTHDSFPEIGQMFGGRDHTTVMHACDKIAKLRECESAIERDYQALLATLEFS